MPDNMTLLILVTMLAAGTAWTRAASTFRSPVPMMIGWPLIAYALVGMIIVLGGA